MSQELRVDDEDRAERERAEHIEGGGGGGSSATKRVVMGLAVAVFSVIAYYAAVGIGTKKAEKVEKVTISKSATFEPASVPKFGAEPAAAAVIPPRPEPAIVVQPPPAPKGPDMMDAARRAPVVAFQKRGPSSLGRASEAGFGFEERAEDGGNFDRLLKPTRLAGARAGHIGNRNFIVAMGTSIPCVLETALQSDQPGFATCVTNRDVMSDNGRVVLMAKGTQIVGEYRGGLKQGQSRLFVLWNRAKTPEGVIITMASPATDALGRAGFDGYVDSHWWERFGSALLLSIVGDIAQIGSDQLADGEIKLDNTSDAGKEAAAIAVEQSGDIKPTLHKHQGELVNIMVARDMDFSQVYRLQVLRPEQRSRAWEPGGVVVMPASEPDPQWSAAHSPLK